MENNEYCYTLRTRYPDFNTYPEDGLIRIEEADNYRFGLLVYDRLLSQSIIDKYEMIAI
jgi:hypothetical protein